MCIYDKNILSLLSDTKPYYYFLIRVTMSLHTTLGKALYALLLFLFIGLYAPHRVAAQSDIVFSNITFTKPTVEPGEWFNYAYDFTNSGTADIAYGVASAKVYLSKDKILSADDTEMSVFDIGTVPIGGGETQRSRAFAVPISFAIGNYYLIFKIEGDGNATNNTIVAPQSITVLQRAGQFLVITNVAGTTTAKPGDVITLNVTVKNQGLSASSGVSTLRYVQEDKSYSARLLSYNKLVLPVIAPNEEKTLTVNFKLRDTLYAPNATFVTSNAGYNTAFHFGDYFLSLTTNNTTPTYGCFVTYSTDCTSKKYNITPIYPKANVSLNMAVSKTLLQFDEKFSATYTITNNSGSPVHDLFVNLGSFTNENRNYSPTSYSPIYQQEVIDANSRLVSAFGESNNFGWEVFNLKVGETRKLTLNFTAPFKAQYGSYGAYGSNTNVSVFYPSINPKSSFENTAAPIAAKDPIKVVLDLSQIADIALSNLTIPNPTVAENGVLNFKFDLKNLGTAPVPQKFSIKSALYKDAALNEFVLEDGVITTGNIAAGGQVLGVMGALTAKLPPGIYYLRVAAYEFASPLPELNKGNNFVTVATPIIVTGNACKGDLTLDTQAKVNAFNRTCTTWDGSIDIGGSVTDLTPLSNLNIVTGRFVIGGANQLTNVQGLNNLQKTGIFVLNGNANITSLAALSKLNAVSTTFILSTMPKLTELGLQTITLNTVTHAEVFDLPNLNNTGNFLLKTPYLTEILVKGGMTNIDFLKGIPSFGLLQLTECPNLLHVNGLSQTTTFDNLIIATHKSLTNLDGLAQTKKVNQTLTIADNPALKSCCGVVNALKNSTPTTLNILGNLSGCNSKEDILATCSKPTAIPDLTLANLTLTQTSVEKGKVLNFKFDLRNIGTANAPSNFSVKSYLSKDNVLSADDVQDGIINTGNINAGAMVAQVMGALTANVAEGKYYVILKVDADNQVAESNENNNTIAATQPIFIGNTTTTPPIVNGIPKITINATNKNIVAKAGENINLSVTIGNFGTGDAANVLIKGHFSVLACPSFPCPTTYYGELPMFKVGLVRVNTLKEYLVGLQLPTTIPVGTYSLVIYPVEQAADGAASTFLFLNLKVEAGTATPTPTPTPTNNSIELTATPMNIAVQQWGWADFEVTVKNNTSIVANNLQVNVPLPSSDFVYAAERFSPSNTNFNTHTGVWSVGNLAAGASKTFKVSMYVLKNSGSYKTNVTIIGTNTSTTITFGNANSTPTPTPNPAPTAGADISIGMRATPTTYTQYSNLTFTVTVTNNAQQVMNGVKVDFNYIESGKLPFVSAKTSIGNYNGHTKIWQIGTLNGGQSVTMDLVLYPLVKGEDLAMKVTVVPTDAMPQNNTATLTLKNAVSARNETNTTAGFGIQNIYPNPAEDIVTIDLKNETEGELYLTIFDTFGRIAQKAVQRVSKNNPSIQVEIAELPEGMYILQLSDATHRTSFRKFVK